MSWRAAPEALAFTIAERRRVRRARIDTGDSIQVTAALRRVDASDEAFIPQQGWSCSATASSPVAGAVTLSTTDADLVRLGADGWIRGLRFGTAAVMASSTIPAATRQFAVLVRAP